MLSWFQPRVLQSFLFIKFLKEEVSSICVKICAEMSFYVGCISCHKQKGKVLSGEGIKMNRGEIEV